MTREANSARSWNCKSHLYYERRRLLFFWQSLGVTAKTSCSVFPTSLACGGGRCFCRRGRPDGWILISGKGELPERADIAAGRPVRSERYSLLPQGQPLVCANCSRIAFVLPNEWRGGVIPLEIAGQQNIRPQCRLVRGQRRDGERSRRNLLLAHLQLPRRGKQHDRQAMRVHHQATLSRLTKVSLRCGSR